MMRKYIIGFTVLCTLLASNCQAQIVKQYGVKLAVTSSNQKFDYSQFSLDDNKRRIGVNAAVFMELFNGSFYSIMPQLEYSQRGMGAEIVLIQTSKIGPENIKKFMAYSRKKITAYSRVDYLSIPIFAKLFLDNELVEPYVLIGPRLDFFLGYDSEYFHTVYKNFKRTTLGGSVAIGCETKLLLSLPITIEARYNHDFTDSYKTEFLKVRNNAFDLWLGVSLLKAP